MKRFLALAATIAASVTLASSQQYQPRPYAPRQPYPTQPTTPYINPALSNYYRQNMQRPATPWNGRYPTNFTPGMRTNSYPSGAAPTNFAPSSRFQPNAMPGTNYAPRATPGATPYAYTNLLPRTGFGTNTSRFAPTQPGLPGYLISQTNLSTTRAFDTNASLAPIPATNPLDAPTTNSQSRLAITPALRRNIDRLSLVMNGIKSVPVSASQRQQLLGVLKTCALGPIKPTDSTTAKLVEDLAAAWPSKGFAFQQKFQLSLDVVRVLNCDNLNEGEVLVVVNDARRVFQSIGIGGETAGKLVDDLQAIAGEVRGIQSKEEPPASEPQE